jgi:uncharacterized membrane protein
MNVSPDTMRMMLLACIAGMALLAAFYLRRRDLTTREYIAWGLLALLVPLLGPFLVILNHPGRLRPEFRQMRVRHISTWFFFSTKTRRLEQRVHSWLVRLHQG